MALLLGTMPQDPVDQCHKQWFRTMLPLCHALAARITLTVQKELQMLAVQTGMSAGQLRAAASASQGVAGGALIQIPSPTTMSSADEEWPLRAGTHEYTCLLCLSSTGMDL